MPEDANTANQSRDAESLRIACGREGCPVCTVVLEAMQLYMDTWQYEGFTDVEHRQQLIRSRGFCPLHTWQLAQHHTSFQLAVVYREVLTDVLDELKQQQKNSATQSDNSSKSEPVWKTWWKKRDHQRDENSLYAQCPLCRTRGNVEDRLIPTLLEQLRTEEGCSLLSQSTGLCLVHFTQAHNQAITHNPAILPHLLECQRASVQRVLEEVQELIRKHDYRFSEESWGNEMTSWRRAAELCAGNPGVR